MELPCSGKWILKGCFFGEHLLIQSPHLPVAIVESEKTAIMASVYLPRHVWLAAGSLNNISADRAKPLYRKNVTLFPDLNGYDKWLIKAKELSGINRVIVSDLLEKYATDQERNAGLELVDYPIQFDYREFINANHTSEGS